MALRGGRTPSPRGEGHAEPRGIHYALLLHPGDRICHESFPFRSSNELSSPEARHGRVEALIRCLETALGIAEEIHRARHVAPERCGGSPDELGERVAPRHRFTVDLAGVALGQGQAIRWYLSSGHRGQDSARVQVGRFQED